MPTRPTRHQHSGYRTKAQRDRDHDAKRGSAADRGYDGAWAKARKAYLAKHPHCVMCAKAGRIVEATVVDHIVPHKGDKALFWDSANNWQSLCAAHHNGAKQSMERGGRAFAAIGVDGWPVEG